MTPRRRSTRPPRGACSGGSGGRRKRAEIAAARSGSAAALRNSPRKPAVLTTSSPRAGPTAPETSPEIPKIPRAWPRRSGGTRSTTTVKFAMKKTEKAAPCSARSSGKSRRASGAAANRSATADVSTAPVIKNARRPPRSTHAPTTGWTTIAVALWHAMISPSCPSVAPSCRRWSGRRTKPASPVKKRKLASAAVRNAAVRIIEVDTAGLERAAARSEQGGYVLAALDGEQPAGGQAERRNGREGQRLEGEERAVQRRA